MCFPLGGMKVNLWPLIIAEMVKPAQKIDSIKIHQVTGLTGGNFGNGIPGADKPVVNQALDSIMGMAVQLPALKKLGDELGLSREDVIERYQNGARCPENCDGRDFRNLFPPVFAQ